MNRQGDVEEEKGTGTFCRNAEATDAKRRFVAQKVPVPFFRSGEMTTAITLDELIALGDEIGALVRAGVPLEQGLAELGSDMPGRMGRLATVLAQRSSGGEPLDRVIADETEQLPAAYRAVVQAGLRAGRLPAALESVASAARRISQSQRAIVVAAAYPLLVFMIAWVALALLSVTLIPRLAADFDAFGAPGSRFFHFLTWLGHGAIWWGPLGPLVVLSIFGAWWYAATRARSLYAGWAHRLLRRVPWVGPMLRWSQTATFLELLAMLVENQVPLHEGVLLAGRASGDAELARSAEQLAAALSQVARPTSVSARLAQQCCGYRRPPTAGQASSATRRRRVAAVGALVDLGCPARRRLAAGAAVHGRCLSPPCPAASRGRAGVFAGRVDHLRRRQRRLGLWVGRLWALCRPASLPGECLNRHGETRPAHLRFVHDASVPLALPVLPWDWSPKALA